MLRLCLIKICAVNYAERKPAVELDTVFNQLCKQNVMDKFGKLISFNDLFWNQISQNLDGKIAPKCLYISVLQNRNGWMNKLREIYAYSKHENSLGNTSEDESLFIYIFNCVYYIRKL